MIQLILTGLWLRQKIKYTRVLTQLFHSLFHILFNCRVRTSSGTFLARGRDKIVQRIEKRIADFTFIPVGMHFRVNSEVLR